MKTKKYSFAALFIALVLVVGATAAFAIGPDNSVTGDPMIAEAEDTTAPGDLLSVTLEDESKFTAEEWADIMKRVEAGEVLLFDTLEEESDYWKSEDYWESEQEEIVEEIVTEAEDTTAQGELLSVNLEDRSKFTAEEWADIMEKVEAGDVLLFDTLEEESDYYLELWESEQEETVTEAEDTTAQD